LSSIANVALKLRALCVKVFAVVCSNKTALWDKLTAKFGRKVDLLTWKSIKNPYLLREVESTQEMLYAA
jgi:predicted nucleotidyltransferase